MFTVFGSMFIFALVGSISPGPVNIIATGTGASFGFRRTLPHVLGATLAYTLIVFVAGIGLQQVLHTFPKISQIIQYAGGAFLLYMSYKIATATPYGTNNINREKTPPTLVEGALSQGLNPKAWLVSVSGVSLFVLTNSPALMYLLVFCAISFTVCFAGVSTWAAIGHLIGSYISTRKRQVAFNVLMGLLLSCTVLSIFINQ